MVFQLQWPWRKPSDNSSCSLTLHLIIFQFDIIFSLQTRAACVSRGWLQLSVGLNWFFNFYKFFFAYNNFSCFKSSRWFANNVFNCANWACSTTPDSPRHVNISLQLQASHDKIPRPDVKGPPVARCGNCTCQQRKVTKNPTIIHFYCVSCRFFPVSDNTTLHSVSPVRSQGCSQPEQRRWKVPVLESNPGHCSFMLFPSK